MSEPIARLREGIREVTDQHASLMPPGGSGVVDVDDLAALGGRVRSERSWVTSAHGDFDAHQRHAELYALLLMEADQQISALLTTPGKGIVDAASGAGSPVSRLASAILGLRDLEGKLA